MNRMERIQARLNFKYLTIRYPRRIKTQGRNYFHNGRVVFSNHGLMVLNAGNLFEEKHHLEIDGGLLMIGSNNYFNRNVKIFCLKQIKIGNDCLFADSVSIYDHDHKFEDLNRPIREQGYLTRNVNIGNNVWVGTNSLILKGVRIGDNAIVAAGAIVTKDVPENSVVGGVPAKVLRLRTSPRLEPL